MLVNRTLCILRDRFLSKEMARRNSDLITFPDVDRIFDIETHFLDKKECGNNSKYLQLSTYITLIDRKTREIFCYKRASAFDDDIMKNKHSVGVGGRVSNNVSGDETLHDLLTEESLRFLWSEVGVKRSDEILENIKNKFSRHNFGIIYSSEDKELKTHLCLSLILPVDKSDIEVIGNKVVTNGKWLTTTELIDHHNAGKIELERWAKAIVYIIKKHIDA